MSAWLEHPLQYWKAGGPLLLPLAFVCFGIWFYFLRSRGKLLRASTDVFEIEDNLQQHDWKRLEAMTGTPADFVKQVLKRWHGGCEVGIAFDEESGRFIGQLRRDIVILVALTTVAPLLGLLGTVMGMIDTFDAVAATSGETATRVASGVSRALITTQVGLVVAIPGFFGLARLRRLLHHLQVQLGAVKLHLIQLEDER
jgi:biopolymer transport protein ExbB